MVQMMKWFDRKFTFDLPGEPARKFAEYLRECATPEQVRVAFAVGAASDVSDLLPQVSTPTMVVRHAKPSSLEPRSRAH